MGWICLGLATLPLPVRFPLPNLDHSWMVGLFMAAHERLRFGTEIVWTYGPLGFLDWNLYVYHGLWVGSLLTSIAIHVALVGLVYAICSRHAPPAGPRRWAVFGAAAISLLLASPLLYLHKKLLLLAALVLYDALDRAPGPARSLRSGAAAILLAATSLIKLSGLVSALSMLAVFVAFELRARGARRAAVFLGLFATACGLGWIWTGQSGSSLAAGWRPHLEILRGYETAMGLPGPPLEWLLGAAAWTGFNALLLIAWARGRRGVAVFLSLTWFLLLIEFKQGFVRHDEHATLFFSFALLESAILLAIASRDEAPRGWMLGGSLAALLLLCVMGQRVFREVSSFDQVPGSVWTLPESVGTAVQLGMEPEARRAALASARRSLLSPFGLTPEALKRWLGDARVDILPWDAAIAWAGGLRWAPRPVFQSYAAYTPDLDRLNRRHFEGDNAPEFLLWRWTPDSIDTRYVLHDAPETLRAILCRYRYADWMGEMLLLRRTEGRCGAQVDRGRVSTTIGTAVALPDAKGILFAAVDVRETRRGRLTRSLLGTGRLGIDLPGLRGPRRLVPSLAASGLIVRPAPFSEDQFVELMSGSPLPVAGGGSIRVVRLPNPWDRLLPGEDYARAIGIHFFELRPVKP